MKLYLRTLLVFTSIFLGVATVQAQQLYPVYWDTSSTVLTSMDFGNDSIGIVVGSNGTILRTIDEGFKWDKITAPVSEDFNDIYFCTLDSVFIVGTNGTVLFSDDTGSTWVTQNSTVFTDLNAIEFHKIFTNIGYAVGGTGTVVKTTDGGQTWADVSPVSIANYSDLSFIHPDTVFVASGSGGGIYHTDDGGTNWNSFVPTDGYTLNTIGQIHFTSSNVGYVLDNSGYPSPLLKTIDKGTTWRLIHEGLPTMVNAFDFKDDTTGYVLPLWSGPRVNTTITGGGNSGPYSAEWSVGSTIHPNWGTPPYPNYADPQCIKIKHINGVIYTLSAYDINADSGPTSGYYEYQIMKSTNHYNGNQIIYGIFSESYWPHFSGIKKSLYNKAYLVKLNADSSTTLLDSIITTSEGIFSFNTKEDSVFVKVQLSESAFPGHPTVYNDSILTINDARLFTFANGQFEQMLYYPVDYDSSTFGGGAVLGGSIIPNGSSVLKTTASSYEGINVYLVNKNDRVAAETVTDNNAYFVFNDLDSGYYRIYVDLFEVDNQLSDRILVCDDSKDSLQFEVRDSLEVTDDFLPACVNCDAGYSYTASSTTATFQSDVPDYYPVDSLIWKFDNGTTIDTSTQQNPSYDFVNTGKYEVCMEVFFNTGDSCSYCDSVEVFYEECMAGFSFANITTDVAFSSTSVVSPGLDSLVWKFHNGGIDTSTQLNPFYDFLAEGRYKVCLEVFPTVGDSCSYCDSIDVVTTGLEEDYLSTIIDVVPNPSSGKFTVEFAMPVNGKVNMVLSDIVGNKIWERKKVSTNTVIPASAFPSGGIYILKVEQGERQAVFKLIKE